MNPVNLMDGLSFEHDPQGRPDLSTLEGVGGVLATFATLVLDQHHAFRSGAATREDAMQEVADACVELGDAFMGRNPDYACSDWNSTTRLGAHIRASGQVSFKEASDPGEAFFRWLSTQILAAARDLDSGTAPEEVGPALRGTLQSAASFLLTGEG